jgi:hypothetical protein
MDPYEFLNPGDRCSTRGPRPRERLWTLAKSGNRIDAGLMFHAEHGVEIQFLHEGAMAYGRRWSLRAGTSRSSRAARRVLALTSQMADGVADVLELVDVYQADAHRSGAAIATDLLVGEHVRMQPSTKDRPDGTPL